MTAEIADGWLPLFYSPRMDGVVPRPARRGVREARPSAPADDFEVVATVPVVLGDDVESAADSVRPFIALYVGGMGAKGANFHRDVLDRLGYSRGVRRDPGALPRRRPRPARSRRCRLELVRDIALVGTADDIRAQLPAWEATAITTMLVQADPRTLPAIAAVLSPTA